MTTVTPTVTQLIAHQRRKVASASAMIDRAALMELSASSIPRPELIARGFRGYCGSTDLFRVGYFIRHWYHIGERIEVLEYRARLSKLPRVTAHTYERQVAVHRALGLPVVGRGERYLDLGEGQRSLWDGVTEITGTGLEPHQMPALPTETRRYSTSDGEMEPPDGH